MLHHRDCLFEGFCIEGFYARSRKVLLTQILLFKQARTHSFACGHAIFALFNFIMSQAVKIISSIIWRAGKTASMAPH